jgi:hypothetical protein
VPDQPLGQKAPGHPPRSSGTCSVDSGVRGRPSRAARLSKA